jgi:hypothetical protein
VAASPATTGLSGVTGTGSTTTVSGLTAGITYTLQYLFLVVPSGISSNVAVTSNKVSFNGTSWSGTPDLTKTGLLRQQYY